MDVQTNRGKFLNSQMRDFMPWGIGGYHNDSDENSSLLHVMLYRRVKIFRRFERILVTQILYFVDPTSRHKFLLTTNLMHLFHVFIYSFHLSTCFEHQVLIIRRSNCINTSSGMISLRKWLLGMPDLHTKQSLTQTNHTRRCINTIWPPDDEHLMFETCKERK